MFGGLANKVLADIQLVKEALAIIIQNQLHQDWVLRAPQELLDTRHEIVQKLRGRDELQEARNDWDD